MGEVVIALQDVSVLYVLGDFRDIGLKDYILQRLKGTYRVNTFWALNGITFQLERGDMLGILGSNGAGKSTLLKAVSGIMRPTRGQLSVKGNIAALLELGSGFDGEMTVRENTYLRGAMMGYPKDFMNEMYTSIISFAELSHFQNTPFKHLSSGMKSRLAFAIASLVNPEILILDEVLSVGDGAFKKKSEKKMMDIIKGGTTTLFVSHQLAQVKSLCNKAIWIDNGKQQLWGEAKMVCEQYEAFLQENEK